MKKMLVMLAVVTVLLTGCGQSGASEISGISGIESESDFTDKMISEIHIHEIGGEDGRDQDWSILNADGCNSIIFTDHRMQTELTYHVSDEDFRILMDTNFAEYIGIKADMENIVDAVYDTIEIIYDDGTEDTAEIYIPALWDKLYEIMGTYEPEKSFPETGTIGKYVYTIDNDMPGSPETRRERGYYFEEENSPDSPLFVYLCSGEQTLGADIAISDLSVDGDKLIITVTETFDDTTYNYDAVDCPQCMIEIRPKPETVEVRSTNGVDVPYRDISLYYKEISQEDIVSDEEHGIKYAKNQLLISTFPETEKTEVETILEEIDAEIVGYIELTGDYQIAFRDDKSLEELQAMADYLYSYSFVMNVTLNMIADVTVD
ncbi:MAG: hypothetical protein K2J71_10240 [Oscillospiraceae bacterium]|nr:hypothetical protein [Oscillospiraceae bacterium]